MPPRELLGLKPATTYPAIVGGVLAKIRNDRNLRQDELAQSVGITQATWSRIECGHCSITVEHLRKAADKLGASPGEILKYADRAESDFRKKGGYVSASHDSLNNNQKVVLIAAGALLIVIAAAIMASQRG
jgi:transcriptional regulator with XRE-family HTH domain